MKRLGLTVFALILSLSPAFAQLKVKIGVLRQVHSKETLSFLDVPTADDFVAGARLGLADNNSTGQFTGQSFELDDVKVAADQDPNEALAKFASEGVTLLIADLPASKLLDVAGKAPDMLIFNGGAGDENLREEDCRANLVHVGPSRSMRADAVLQYLIWKQWKKFLLIKGSHPEDELLATAYRNSAKKFGAKIVEERIYTDTGGSRRTDSGSVQVQRQVPVLTQGAPPYDVVIAADESQVFAGYLPYRIWDARPVVGSAGLMPLVWDAAHEQWGAAQLQNRFTREFKRTMNERDNVAWLAMRMIGEAVTRSGKADAASLRAAMLAPEFSFAAFKGEKLSLRPWNQQVRQPILLSDGRTIVSSSPQEGFLHQTSELDTLGIDQPESKCKLTR